MRLYFNGCSHTYGDDLTNPAVSAWPAILAKEYGATLLNDSVSGGTNDRIMYRVVKQIDQFDKFYIAWTYSSRFTRYRADNNFEVNFNSQLVNDLYGQDPDFLTYGKIHYTTWFNELYSFKLWLQQIILLQALFESRNKQYLMINATNNLIDRWTVDWPNFNNSVQSLLCFDSMNDHQLFLEYQEIQSLLKNINCNRFVGWNTWWITKLHDSYTLGPTGHLLENGHRAVATYVKLHECKDN
jgi:hypothetical protein